MRKKEKGVAKEQMKILQTTTTFSSPMPLLHWASQRTPRATARTRRRREDWEEGLEWREGGRGRKYKIANDTKLHWMLFILCFRVWRGVVKLFNPLTFRRGLKEILVCGGSWEFKGLLHPLRSIGSFRTISQKLQLCLWSLSFDHNMATILSHNIHFPDPGRIPKAIHVFSSIFKILDSWILRFTLCTEKNSFYLKVVIEIQNWSISGIILNVWDR